MSEVEVAPPSPMVKSKSPSRSPKKAKVPKKRKPAQLAAHPPYAQMINAAVVGLKERGGSSRQAIEKYIKANFKVSGDVGTHLKMALKRGTASGRLIHTKGKGASGSFKVGAKPKAAAKPKKKAAKKKPAKKAGGKKKKAAPKKKVAKKAAKSPKKKKAAKKAKSPAKKKAAKTKKATKAKSPRKAKPKKAAKSPKKGAAKKKTTKNAKK